MAGRNQWQTLPSCQKSIDEKAPLSHNQFLNGTTTPAWQRQGQQKGKTSSHQGNTTRHLNCVRIKASGCIYGKMSFLERRVKTTCHQSRRQSCTQSGFPPLRSEISKWNWREVLYMNSRHVPHVTTCREREPAASVGKWKP